MEVVLVSKKRKRKVLDTEDLDQPGSPLPKKRKNNKSKAEDKDQVGLSPELGVVGKEKCMKKEKKRTTFEKDENVDPQQLHFKRKKKRWSHQEKKREKLKVAEASVCQTLVLESDEPLRKKRKGRKDKNTHKYFLTKHSADLIITTSTKGKSKDAEASVCQNYELKSEQSISKKKKSMVKCKEEFLLDRQSPDMNITSNNEVLCLLKKEGVDTNSDLPDKTVSTLAKTLPSALAFDRSGSYRRAEIKLKTETLSEAIKIDFETTMEKYSPGDVITSKFKFHDNKFALDVYPNGIDDTCKGYVSVYLTNWENKEVALTRSIVIQPRGAQWGWGKWLSHKNCRQVLKQGPFEIELIIDILEDKIIIEKVTTSKPKILPSWPAIVSTKRKRFLGNNKNHNSKEAHQKKKKGKSRDAEASGSQTSKASSEESSLKKKHKEKHKSK